MMFGNPQRFAIELELLPDCDGLWMNGRSCFWISGTRIGDFGLIDSLRDLLFLCEKMSCDKDRSGESLFSLDAQELMTTLCCGLYDAHRLDQETYYQRGIEGQWARYNINPTTIPFLGWSIFLIENGSFARCVYTDAVDAASNTREQKLQLGELNQVLDDAIAHLLGVYHQFRGE